MRKFKLLHGDFNKITTTEIENTNIYPFYTNLIPEKSVAGFCFATTGSTIALSYVPENSSEELLSSFFFVVKDACLKRTFRRLNAYVTDCVTNHEEVDTNKALTIIKQTPLKSELFDLHKNTLQAIFTLFAHRYRMVQKCIMEVRASGGMPAQEFKSYLEKVRNERLFTFKKFFLPYNLTSENFSARNGIVNLPLFTHSNNKTLYKLNLTVNDVPLTYLWRNFQLSPNYLAIAYDQNKKSLVYLFVYTEVYWQNKEWFNDIREYYTNKKFPHMFLFWHKNDTYCPLRDSI